MNEVERRPWPGDPRYLVGEDGTVVGARGRVASQFVDNVGYPCVYAGGRTRRVHVLVAETFLGPRPVNMYVTHRDGDKTNNAVGNLRYGSPAQNSQDQVLHGTAARGERMGTAKLCEDDVRAIRSAYAAGDVTYMALARRYGVGMTTIYWAVARETWRHVS